MKPIIYFIIVSIFINSCQTKKNTQSIDIIENEPFLKSNFYKYEYENFVNYCNYNNQQKVDSFRPIVYTVVKPLSKIKKFPEKVYALSFDSNRWKESLSYFKNDLKGKNISYLEKDNKIIIRNFYIDYNINKKNSNPTNIQELEKFLKSKKILYKILNTKKEGSYFIIDLIANNNLYKIILDKNHCTSYLFYDKKDTICFKGYSNILISFFQ